jgi:hypothetical protein
MYDINHQVGIKVAPASIYEHLRKFKGRGTCTE